MTSLSTLEHLDPAHLDAAIRAIRNVISSDIAESTFSQIVDGMPSFETYIEFHYPPNDHPVNDHETLCDGALEKTRELRADFDPLTLAFDLRAVQAFQNAEIGSAEFEIRLVELTAIACHQIAVHLYQLDDGVHKHGEHEAWLREALSRVPKDRPHTARLLPPPTMFFHRGYLASHQYPHGIADVVGYWAEARIFGGVVVFDRGESESEAKGVFLHAGRVEGPRTLYPPTESQHRALIRFFLSEPGQDPCPLPLLDSMDNRPRYEAYDAFAYFHIFRDRYERELPPERRLKDVISGVDFPELEDQHYIFEKTWAQALGEPIDEAELAAAQERMKNITPSSPCWRGPRPWL